MDYKRSILEYCSKLGLDIVGFSECRVFNELRPYFENRKSNELENEFEEKDIEKRVNPFLYMEDGKTIISIAFPYLFDKSFEDENGFSKYTHGRDYHVVVSQYLKKICDCIEELGGKALYFVDSNSLPERYIAVESGIGFIGKNNTLITEKYGSYVFLGEIITNLYIEKNESLENRCGSCVICEKECPTGAIRGENKPNICLSYITQKKDIQDKWFDRLNGRVFGCDTCQRLCPFNKDIKASEIEEFKPYDFMEKVELDELISLDKKTFRDKYSKTSCGWRGKNIIQRNALVNKICQNKNIKPIKFSSPYVENYYNRILNYFKL